MLAFAPRSINMRPPVSRLSRTSLLPPSTSVFLCISLGWLKCDAVPGNTGCKLPAPFLFVATSDAWLTHAHLLLGMWPCASGSFPPSLAVLTHILPFLDSLSPPCSPLSTLFYLCISLIQCKLCNTMLSPWLSLGLQNVSCLHRSSLSHPVLACLTCACY